MGTIFQDIKSAANPKNVAVYQNFFKTGKGEYGEGDVFLGITVPQSQAIAKKHSGIPEKDRQKLFKSKYHEERLIALLMLVEEFKNGDTKKQKKVFDYYVKNRKYVNNWDLVDLTADKIVGEWLFTRNKKLLYDLVLSPNLWERRIAIIASFAFIKKGTFTDALKLSQKLLKDDHDLIHKAVGWMVREIGNRDIEVEEKFLKKHYTKMPRTMLRYAIERFPEKKRLAYLKGTV